jgi:hypothetical protein
MHTFLSTWTNIVALCFISTVSMSEVTRTYYIADSSLLQLQVSSTRKAKSIHDVGLTKISDLNPDTGMDEFQWIRQRIH